MERCWRLVRGRHGVRLRHLAGVLDSSESVPTSGLRCGVRSILASLCLLPVLAACGGGSDGGLAEPSSPSSPTSAASPAEGFFVEADSTELNAAAQQAQDALAVVGSAKQIRRCNTAGDRGYDAWRKCFHQGLDPLVSGLDKASTKLEEMSDREFVSACQDALGSASTVLAEQRDVVAKMLKVVDGPPGAAVQRFARNFEDDAHKVRDTVSGEYSALTQACYSPEDLASINASPSSSN